MVASLIRSLSVIPTTYKDERGLARFMIAKLAIEKGDYLSARDHLDTLIYLGDYSLATTDQIAFGKEAIYGYNLYPMQDTINQSLYAKGDYRNIVRLTEAFLLDAEVYQKMGVAYKAVEYLNKVRQRNGESLLPNTTINVTTYLSSEYSKDMKNEGVYFAFLKRNNLAQSQLSLTGNQLLFPIPISEIILNPYAQQNPGY